MNNLQVDDDDYETNLKYDASYLLPTRYILILDTRANMFERVHG